jgi:lycopene cyclase domain-containing protein
MENKYYYLLIDIATIFFPLALSFDKKVAFYKHWLPLFRGLLLGGIVFLIWDHYFTINGVWSFNQQYIAGKYIASLPIEEVLFFILIPYACIFIEFCVRAYFPKIDKLNFAKAIWFLIMVFSALMLALYNSRIYTLVTFSLLLVLSTIYYYCVQAWHHSFLVGFVISIVPFFIVNGLLTSIPIVLYNNAENVNFRWGTIPFEDSWYMLGLLLLIRIGMEGRKFFKKSVSAQM